MAAPLFVIHSRPGRARLEDVALQVVVAQRSDFFQAIVPAAAPIGYVAGNGFDLQPIDAPQVLIPPRTFGRTTTFLLLLEGRRTRRFHRGRRARLGEEVVEEVVEVTQLREQAASTRGSKSAAVAPFVAVTGRRAIAVVGP